MVKKLRKLSLAIKDQNNDEAIKTYCDLIKSNIPQKDIVFNILKDTIPILYRNKYHMVPHGLMGISSALNLSKFLEEDKSLPLAQAIWYLANENKLAPLDFSVYVPNEDLGDDAFELLEKNIRQADIPKTYRLYLGLIKKHGFNDTVKSQLFELAMQDTINIGHKAIYCIKMFELIKYLDTLPGSIHYPYVAYTASTPKDYSIYNLVYPEVTNLEESGQNFENNKFELSEDEATQFIHTIVNGFKSKIMLSMRELLTEGKSIQSIADTIAIAASMLVLNTDYDEWLKPIHGFNYCHSLNKWIRKYNSNNKILALYMAAFFINTLSIEHKKVHFEGASFYVKHKGILNNIVKSINNSNISDTLCLTKSYLLSNQNNDLLIKNLVTLAVENDSLPNFTHDMKFATCSVNEYKQNKSPKSWMILTALAKHLSQSTKDYSCYNLYKSLIKQ